MEKPTATKKTSKIFKNHLKSETDIKKFNVEKSSSDIVVTDIKNNVQYQITLAVPKAHVCHLACGYCGFCVHTFRCSCSSNTFHGDFCIHLHFLSTVRTLLPQFEQPINAQIDFFKNAGMYSNGSAAVGNLVTTQQNPTETIECVVSPDSNSKCLPCSAHTSFAIEDSADLVFEHDNDLSDYNTGCDFECENLLHPLESTKEEQFKRAIQNL